MFATRAMCRLARSTSKYVQLRTTTTSTRTHSITITPAAPIPTVNQRLASTTTTTTTTSSSSPLQKSTTRRTTKLSQANGINTTMSSTFTTDASRIAVASIHTAPITLTLTDSVVQTTTSSDPTQSELITSSSQSSGSSAPVATIRSTCSLLIADEATILVVLLFMASILVLGVSIWRYLVTPIKSTTTEKMSLKKTTHAHHTSAPPVTYTSDDLSTPATAASSSNQSSWSGLKNIIVPLCAGSVFGAAFQLSRVHEFFFIRSQMLMEHFVMLKMFLTAAAVSTLIITTLPYLSQTLAKRISGKSSNMSKDLAQKRGLPSLIFGASLIGVGMSVCGSCPGTVFAQVASGSIQARYVLLGGLFAGFVFPLLDLIPGFDELLSAGQTRIQNFTLPQMFNANTISVGVPLAGAFLALVAAIEYFVPWQHDLGSLLPKSDIHGSSGIGPSAISPYAAGALVGLLQLPLLVFLDNHLGCSSSYVTVAANFTGFFNPSASKRVPLYAALKSNYWQVLMMGGIMIGAYTTSSLSGNTFKSDHLLTPMESFIGGTVLVTGARIAAGCPSGHGISGMGYLAINSFLAVAAMFGSGILTAMVLYR